MNYCHIQLHQGNKNDYSKEDILKIVKTGYIGLDINQNFAKELGCNDKPFNKWTDEDLEKYNEKENTWKAQIKSFLSLKPGDYVIVRHGKDFIALTEITDNYIFEEADDLVWFRHRYPVKILATYKDLKKNYTFPKYQGTFEISKSGETYEIIKEIIKDYKNRNIDKYQQIIDAYIEFYKSDDNWNEDYKWETVTLFQEKWNPDIKNKELKKLLNQILDKQENLISWRYSDNIKTEIIEKHIEKFKEILNFIFDENISLKERYEYFKTEIKKLETDLGEEVFAFFLTCRYPEKYYFYRFKYYKKFCEYIGEKAVSKKDTTGNKYFHYLKLMNFFRNNYVKTNKEVIELTKQKILENIQNKEIFSLITQTIIYTVFELIKKLDIIITLKEIGYENANNLYNLIDILISELKVEFGDPRLHYNCLPEHNINITIGQRYTIRFDIKKQIWDITVPQETNIPENRIGYKFTSEPFPISFRTNNFDELKKIEKDFLKLAISDLNRTKWSGKRHLTNLNFEKSIFDVEYRQKIFKQIFDKEFEVISHIKLHKKKMHLNQILYGPPGTGKTYHTINKAIEIADNEFYEQNKENRPELKKRFKELLDSGQVVFTTSHQSMSYEEFIEGLKPYEENKQVYYKIEDGIFKRICKNAEEQADKNFVIIIDEINRGNIASIFGELITLIEPDKRKDEDEELSVKLPYSKQDFNVPKNLYLIGTMNTADRSVEALDSALRRRFVFVEMPPVPSLLNKNFYGIDLEQLLEKINVRIERLLDKDHKIGHSYFMNLKTIKDLQNVFKNKIIPLLEEYFYGDFAKIGLILGEKFLLIEAGQDKIFMKIENDELDYTDFENRIIFKPNVPEDTEKFIEAVKNIYF